MTRVALLWLSCVGLSIGLAPVRVSAAETWIEVKSPHFTILSNASDGSTRTLAWQLEQIRSALTTLWPWARVDLGRPLNVIALKDERSMREIAPRYWEAKGSIRPASVWVSARDGHYFAIRTDVRVQDTDTLNPYLTAYGAYVSLVLQASFENDLPLWFSNGMSSVLSNTVVRDDHVKLAMPITWHLQYLRERSRMPLAKLVTVNRLSPEYTQDGLRDGLEAHAWAFVHFLMFADGGARRPRLDQFMGLLKSRKDHPAALTEALGRVEDYQEPFINYVNRSIMSFARLNVDANVKREGFTSRPVPAADSAAMRAAFHSAMRRPTEARALLVEARKADSASAAAHVVDGLLLESETRYDEAKAAYAKAVELGSPNAYPYYRWATLSWGRNLDQDTLAGIEKSLMRAIELDPLYANAIAFLAQTRLAMGKPATEAVPLARRAIELEPGEPYHHLVASRIYLRLRSFAAARGEARAALALPATDGERREAEELLQLIDRAEKGGESAPEAAR